MNKVAVVILNWNGKKYLEDFLSIVETKTPNVDIIVADNASTDDSVLYLQENHPKVKLIINSSNSGFAGGYNEALKNIEGQYQYYVLLNSDVEVTNNWLEPIIEFMDKDELIAACQPKVLSYHKKDRFEHAGASGGYIDKDGYPFCRGRIFDNEEEDLNQYDSIGEIFWATGACMFVRADLFHKVGGFDADFFAHMEEIDLCWRLKNMGYKMYVIPASTVYHVGGGTLDYLSPRKIYLNFRNSLYTITKNYKGILFFKIFKRLILDGVAALMFLKEGHFSYFKSVFMAHIHYYGGLGKMLRKRRLIRNNFDYRPNLNGVYPKSIVFSYFLKKKKTFTDLEKFK